jgi:hypothetical protein
MAAITMKEGIIFSGKKLSAVSPQLSAISIRMLSWSGEQSFTGPRGLTAEC